jgi:hypothetical protein
MLLPMASISMHEMTPPTAIAWTRPCEYDMPRKVHT